jgi:hypothetical protein
MDEKAWVNKIKNECQLNIGNFDTRYAIQLVGKSGSKIGIVSLNKQFMNVDIIDREKYTRFYSRFGAKNQKDNSNPLVIDYHIEHNIGKQGFIDLWEYWLKKYKTNKK